MSAADSDRAIELCARGERSLAERAPSQAATFFRRAITADARLARAYIGLGRALNNLRQLDDAEAAFSAAIQLAPADANAHNFLGHVRRAGGHLDDAERAFRRAIACDANLAQAHYNLGTVLAARRRYADAIDAIQRSLELEPENVPTLLTLAELCQFAGRHPDAVIALERAAKIEPDNAAHPAALGDLHYSLGDVTWACDAYDRALAIDPRQADAVAGRALLCELWGDIDAGWRLVAPWMRSDKRPPAVAHAAARLLRRLERTEEALALLEALRDDRERGWHSEPRLWFTLGEVFDQARRWDEAFAAFDRGNALKPALFDSTAHDARVTALVDFFTAERFDRLLRAPRHGPRPVFVVGMPRSGTTLVEQVLASHPNVHAGGERFELLPVFVHELTAATRGDYPAMLASVTAGSLSDLSQRYLTGFGAIDSHASLFTDKLPKNFLNLGLIALMFPDARIVALARDPRDVGLSVYFQNLNLRSDPWAARLEHIAHYTRAHDRLMAHWRDVLPLPMLTISYESIVDDFESHVRTLLEFLALDWEPKCLEFYRTRRLVNTASYAQVRKPLYQSSVGRWHHYEAHLGPLAGLAVQ